MKNETYLGVEQVDYDVFTYLGEKKEYHEQNEYQTKVANSQFVGSQRQKDAMKLALENAADLKSLNWYDFASTRLAPKKSERINSLFKKEGFFGKIFGKSDPGIFNRSNANKFTNLENLAICGFDFSFLAKKDRILALQELANFAAKLPNLKSIKLSQNNLSDIDIKIFTETFLAHQVEAGDLDSRIKRSPVRLKSESGLEIKIDISDNRGTERFLQENPPRRDGKIIYEDIPLSEAWEQIKKKNLKKII